MAKLLREGFECRTAALVFTAISGGSIGTTSPETGACAAAITGTNQYLRRDLGVNYGELFHAFSAVIGSNESWVYHWIASNGSTILGSLRRNASGKLEVYVGSTLVATGSKSLAAGTRYHIQIRVKIADANEDPALTGRIQVAVDTDPDVALDIDYSGDTKPDTNTGMQTLGFGGNGTAFTSAYNSYYDNWGINDTTGETDNSWVGHIQLIPFYPNANGTTSGLTSLDGNQTDNYALVDDLATGANDGDTTYVKATAEGQYDTYGCTDPTIPDGAIIKGVIIEDISRKTNAAVDTQARVVIRSGAADHVGAAHALAITYAKAQTEWATDPAGGGWDCTKINALEIGTEGRGAFA